MGRDIGWQCFAEEHTMLYILLMRIPEGVY